jgi:hypothetical protein
VVRSDSHWRLFHQLDLTFEQPKAGADCRVVLAAGSWACDGRRPLTVTGLAAQQPMPAGEGACAGCLSTQLELLQAAHKLGVARIRLLVDY